MEIPAEVCGPRSVVREIHSAILRYFREIMKRMEVARGALRDERVLVVTLKKKKSEMRLGLRASRKRRWVEWTLDKGGGGANYLWGGESRATLRPTQSTFGFLRPLSFFKPPFFHPFTLFLSRLGHLHSCAGSMSSFGREKEGIGLIERTEFPFFSNVERFSYRRHFWIFNFEKHIYFRARSILFSFVNDFRGYSIVDGRMTIVIKRKESDRKERSVHEIETVAEPWVS